MSTLQVANLHLESTGNNRIQFAGSNSFSIIAGGVNYVTVNTSNMSVNGSIVSANLQVNAKVDNYTLANTDSGSIITMSNTALKTVTVPASLPVGFRCMVYMINTGNVVIGNAAGVTLQSRTSTYTCASRYGSLSVFVYAANTVIVDGALI
jgi:hypothetical protein